MEFTLDEIMDNDLSPRHVSFISTDNGDVRVFGSGSLVSVGNRAGIITCAHVHDTILRLKNDPGICLYPPRNKQVQASVLNRNDIRVVRLPSQRVSEGPKGPDIAFVEAPPSQMDAFRAIGTISDLDRMSARLEATLPREVQCFRVLSGAIYADSPDPIRTGEKVVYSPTGRMLPGNVTRIDEDNDLDLGAFSPAFDGDHQEPSSYGAASGGGLWRVCLNTHSGKHSVELVGVAFFETDSPNRQIIFHGPNSIYRVLRARIEDELGQ
ncbi:hypothetical protein [Nioella sp.]|uniref:hypothetical protein n=1 Tax=Nioella sp. TaxID=1912091 RepID=UPI003A896221